MRPNGATCTADGDCANNVCAQGVCCASVCNTTCRSCALAGTLGTCTNVAAGQDPLNQCTDAGAASCGNDGTCNGAGACRLYVTGTQCAAPTCSGSTATPARTCNGSGTCQAVSTSNCSPFACGTGVCRTTCASNADCTSPNVCLGSVCAPNPNLKVQYRRGRHQPDDQAIKPHFKVVNSGTSAVELSTLTIRYWYTIDTPGRRRELAVRLRGARLQQHHPQQRHAVTDTNERRSLLPGRLRAGAGNLAAGGNTGEIQVWFHKNTWGNYTEVERLFVRRDQDRLRRLEPRDAVPERNPRLGHGAVGFGPLT